MGLFKRLTKSKNPDSKKFKREMAYAVCGQHIKYVTEKRNDVDEVIGRNGGLNIRNDEFIVYASSDVVFRCPIDQLSIWELLSRDGVVLTGPDLEHGGVERTVIAYYVYYRK
jgi:phosphopentomutase